LLKVAITRTNVPAVASIKSAMSKMNDDWTVSRLDAGGEYLYILLATNASGSSLVNKRQRAELNPGRAQGPLARLASAPAPNLKVVSPLFLVVSLD
jgi:hypothetical protein